jgi:DNA-binding transcriptional LysR family regulator
MLNEIDLSRIDLNLLVLFEAVMSERHVARTAKRLHVSPSAVSHGLARLRRTLHDPLFLKHPKGVVPTDRAVELSPPITDILARVRSVVASAEGFDPMRSTRRFTIGAPDAVFPVIAPPLIAHLARAAPQIDLAMRTILPQHALASLDAREADVMIQPLDDVPPRFATTRLYEEEFAVAIRKGHPLGPKLTLAQYCAASHVLVSATGDPFGNVDVELRKLGRSRRIAATVPSFIAALGLVADTDLVSTVPRHSSTYARRFGVVLSNPPAPLAPLGRGTLSLLTSKAAIADAGIAWLSAAITTVVRATSRR